MSIQQELLQYLKRIKIKVNLPINIFIILVGIYIVYVEVSSMSSFSRVSFAFVIWNLSPIFAAFVIINVELDGLYYSKVLATIVAVSVTGVFHILWDFDIGRVATGSSTAALIFIFLPIYSFMGGVLIGLLSSVIEVLLTIYVSD